MAIILHLQNLHQVATNLDIIRFFRGLDIAEGGVQIIGGEDGDTFIKFCTEQDLLRALEFDNQPLLGQRVKLFLAKEDDVQRVVEKRNRELNRAAARLLFTSSGTAYSNSTKVANQEDSVHSAYRGQEQPSRHEYRLSSSTKAHTDNDDHFDIIYRTSSTHEDPPDKDDLPFFQNRPSSSHGQLPDKDDRAYTEDRSLDPTNPFDEAVKLLLNKKSSPSHTSHSASKKSCPEKRRRDHSAERHHSNSEKKVKQQEEEFDMSLPFYVLAAQRDLKKKEAAAKNQKLASIESEDSRISSSDDCSWRRQDDTKGARRKHNSTESDRSSRHTGRETERSREKKMDSSSGTEHANDPELKCVGLYNLDPTVTATDISNFLRFWEIPKDGIVLSKRPNAVVAYVAYYPIKHMSVRMLRNTRLNGRLVEIEVYNMKYFNQIKPQKVASSTRTKGYNSPESTNAELECAALYNLDVTVTATDVRKFLKRWEIPDDGIILTGDKRDAYAVVAYVKYYPVENMEVKTLSGAVLYGRAVDIKLVSLDLFDSIQRECNKHQKLASSIGKGNSRSSNIDEGSHRRQGSHERESTRTQRNSSENDERGRCKSQDRKRAKDHRDSSSRARDGSPYKSSRDMEMDDKEQDHSKKHTNPKREECAALYNLDVSVTATDVRTFLKHWEIPDDGIVLTSDKRDSNAVVAYVLYYPVESMEVKALSGVLLHGRAVDIKLVSLDSFDSAKRTCDKHQKLASSTGIDISQSSNSDEGSHRCKGSHERESTKRQHNSSENDERGRCKSRDSERAKDQRYSSSRARDGSFYKSSRDMEMDDKEQDHSKKHTNPKLEKCAAFLYNLDVNVTASDVRTFLKHWEIPDDGILLTSDKRDLNAVVAYVLYYPVENMEVDALSGALLHGRAVGIKLVSHNSFDSAQRTCDKHQKLASSTGTDNSQSSNSDEGSHRCQGSHERESTKRQHNSSENDERGRCNSRERQRAKDQLDSSSRARDESSYKSSRDVMRESERHDLSKKHTNTTREFAALYNLNFTVTATDVREFLKRWEIPDNGIIFTADKRDPNAVVAYVKYYPVEDMEVKTLSGALLRGLPVDIKSVSCDLFYRERASSLRVQDDRIVRPLMSTTILPQQGMRYPNPVPPLGACPSPKGMARLPIPMPRNDEPGMLGPYPGIRPPVVRPPVVRPPGLRPPVMMPPRGMGPVPKMPPHFVMPQLPGAGSIWGPDRVMMKPLHYMTINPTVLPPVCSACDIWSWFDGPNGPTLHAILVTFMNNQPKAAFVAFLDENIRDEEIVLRKDLRGGARSQADLDRVFARWSKGMVILQSTLSFGDTDITLQVYNYLKDKDFEQENKEWKDRLEPLRPLASAND